MNLLFVPGLVFKLGRSARQRDSIAREVRAIRAAGRAPFWDGLVAPAIRIWRLGFVRRRYRPILLEEFRAVAALVDCLLDAAAAAPRRAMLADLSDRGLFAVLPARQRAILEMALASRLVPATSMHGDLHFFNFMRAGNAYLLLDWEHFDPAGSFVFDYIQFHVSVGSFNSGLSWPVILSQLTPEHPAFRTVAERIGVAPEALLAYYLFIKADTIVQRAGSLDHLPAGQGDILLAALGAAIARLGASAA